MNKQQFFNALNLAFSESKVTCSPNFWNFSIEINSKIWCLYVDDKIANKIENGETVDNAIIDFKNSSPGDYRLTLDPRLPIHESPSSNGLLIKLTQIIN